MTAAERLERALHAPRVALYGGSFDPVHVGHLLVADSALEHFDLDAVLFVPAARSPHKPGGPTASGADRMALLEIALRERPDYAIWDAELERPPPSYTGDTVDELIALRGAFANSPYMIIGSDNLSALERWHAVETMLERARPIVVERDDHIDPAAEFKRLAAHLSRRAMARLWRGYIDLEAPSAASATEVRAGELSDLDQAVRREIEARGLYATR